MTTPSGSIIFHWLERIGLGYSVPTFQAMGITTPQSLMSLTVEDYDAVGVTEVQDRKRLFELVTRVREAAKKPDGKADNATPVLTSAQTGAKAPAATPTGSSLPTPLPTVRHRAQAPLEVSPKNPAEAATHTVQPTPPRRYAGGESPGGNSRGRQRSAEGRRLSTSPPEPTGIYSPAQIRERVSAALAVMDLPDTTVSAFVSDVQLRSDRDTICSTAGSMLQFYSQWRGTAAAEASKDVKPKSYVVAGGVSAPRPATSDGVPPRRLYPTGADSHQSSAPALHGASSSPPPASGGAAPGADDDTPKIKVCVRKRPMNGAEKRRKDPDVIECLSRTTLQVYEPKQKVDLTRYTETHEFMFDDVFDESMNNEDIYRHTAGPLISTVFKGCNATCFAYGQTGSGKTHTMMGSMDGSSPKDPGLYVSAARDIFRTIEERQHRNLAVHISFYEIYGGKLFDLLNDRQQLRALVDDRQAVNIVGLSDQQVASVDALLGLISYGNSVRSTGSTGANSDSSRSHAILQICLKDKKTEALKGKMSFIDLAGSERGADTTHNDRKTRLEGAEINKSLLALKECIRSLYQEADHTPFRGSKLTQVLKDSFLGDSKTVMIATISPNMLNCEHTLNTLRYAYRVKEIRRVDEDDEVTSTSEPAAPSSPLPPPPASSANGGKKQSRSYSAAPAGGRNSVGGGGGGGEVTEEKKRDPGTRVTRDRDGMIDPRGRASGGFTKPTPDVSVSLEDDSDGGSEPEPVKPLPQQKGPIRAGHRRAASEAVVSETEAARSGLKPPAGPQLSRLKSMQGMVARKSVGPAPGSPKTSGPVAKAQPAKGGAKAGGPAAQRAVTPEQYESDSALSHSSIDVELEQAGRRPMGPEEIVRIQKDLLQERLELMRQESKLMNEVDRDGDYASYVISMESVLARQSALVDVIRARLKQVVLPA